MAVLNIQKRKIFKRRRDGQVAQGSSVSSYASVSSSSSSETGNLQDYAKKIDVHIPSQKALLDALSVDAGYFKYNAAGLSVENADKLDGVIASNYARKDQANTFEFSQTINADLYVNGNIIQNGAAYVTHAEQVNIESNLMQLNLGEVGSQITGFIPGTSIPFSGIEINRGSGESYYMGVVEGATPLIKLGKKSNLVTIAAREDNPTDGYAMQWDDANHRIKGVAAVRDSLNLGGIVAANYYHSGNSNLNTIDWAAKYVNARAFRSISTNSDYNLIARSNTNTALYINQGSASGQIASFRYGSMTAGTGTEVLAVDYNLIKASAIFTAYVGGGKKFETTTTGTKTTGNHEVTGAFILNGITFRNSTDRSGLLEITRRGTHSYAGLHTNFSSTAKWSLMGSEDLFGLYDDINNKWHLLARKNNRISLYYNGSEKFVTTNSGAKTIGNSETTGAGIIEGGFLQIKNGADYHMLIGREAQAIGSGENNIIYSYGSKDIISYISGERFRVTTTGTKTTGNALFTGYLQNNGTFASGFGGSGWQIGSNGDATFDNLTVRKGMNVYELNINKIRSGNGSYWFSDGMKYEVDNGTDVNHYRIGIDVDGGNLVHPFAIGDILRCQVWTGSGIKYYTLIVDAQATTTEFSYVRCPKASKTGSGIPEIGDELVRIGNISDTNRQGAVYITSNDNNAPYIDVVDGVTSDSFADKVKVRLGKLNGITDADLGTLTGYGLYAENAYLKGSIVANDGTIGGWRINTSSIDTGVAFGSGGGLELHKTNRRVIVSQDGSNYVNMFYSSSSSWGIIGRTGGTNVFQLGNANKIAGWDFNSYQIYSVNNGFTTRIISAAGTVEPRFEIVKDGHNYVKMFHRTDSEDFGIMGRQGGSTKFQLGSTNQIAGWSFDGTKIYSGATELRTGSNAGLIVRKAVNDSNNWVRINYTSSTNWGIQGSSSGSTIFELGSTNKIAGWTFNSTALYYGTYQGSNAYTTSGMTIHKDGAIRAKYFRVDTDGHMFATDVDISGKIKATISGLTTTVLDGSNIYETSESTDTGVLSINMIGYNAGTTKYRTTKIGNGRNKDLLTCWGGGDEVSINAGNFLVKYAMNVNGMAYLKGGATITGTAAATSFKENGTLLSSKYAAKTHSHTNYLQTSGGTITGDLSVNGDINGMKMVHGAFSNSTDNNQTIVIAGLTTVKMFFLQSIGENTRSWNVTIPTSGNTIVMNRDDGYTGTKTMHYVAFGW